MSVMSTSSNAFDRYEAVIQPEVPPPTITSFMSLRGLARGSDRVLRDSWEVRAKPGSAPVGVDDEIS
jgi:hypothetical protein